MILAGDVGGTNTRLALFARDGSAHLKALSERSYPSREHDSLESVHVGIMRPSAVESVRAPQIQDVRLPSS